MREIKFRGKRLDTGEWVYGYYYTQIITHAGNRKSRDHFIRTEQNIRYEVDPATVGQYTGLKDKHGQEIYEGDIVCDSLGVGVVSFILEHCAYFVETSDPAKRHYMLSHGQLDNTKVIGNIHDNPDLLEGK
jgi:uncharacterized phage protein (TIGR01671 family)